MHADYDKKRKTFSHKIALNCNAKEYYNGTENE